MASDIRPLSSFDARSQKALQNGQTVVAGDGRRFTFINGQPVVENSQTFRNMVTQANGPGSGALAGNVAFKPNGQISQPAPGIPQATYNGRPTSGGTAPITGGTAGNISTGGSAPVANTPAPVTATSAPTPTMVNGALTLPGLPDPGTASPTGAPAAGATAAAAFNPSDDPEYLAAVARLDALLGNSRAEYDAESTSARTRFARMLRDAGQKLPGDLENSTEGAAGRGMLRSGGYLEDQGRIRKQFADYNAQIGEDQTSTLNDLLRSFTATQNDVNSQKQEAMAAAARRRAERAATEQATAAQAQQAAAAQAQAVAPITATPGPAQDTPAPVTAAAPVPSPGAIPYGNGQNPINVAGPQAVASLPSAPQAPAQALARPNAAQISYEQSQYVKPDAAAVRAGSVNDPNAAVAALWKLYGNKPTAGSRPYTGR